MNRKEWYSWALSLKPGDRVIVKNGDPVSVDTVKKVTPSGWVVTEDSGTYSQSTWRDHYQERGGYRTIVPFTKELGDLAAEYEAEQERIRKMNRTVNMAQQIAYNWCYHRLSYEMACKIIKLAGRDIPE